MANWKSVLNNFNKEVAANTEEGKIRERDLKKGLADRIVEKYWDKQDRKWKVEYAKEIMKNKEKENKKC